MTSPGLVLQVDEGQPPGRLRPLAVGDHPGHRHAGPRRGGRPAWRPGPPPLVEGGPGQLGEGGVDGDPGGPQVGGHRLGLVHGRQPRGPVADHDPLELARPRLGQRPRRPQRRPPVAAVEARGAPAVARASSWVRVRPARRDQVLQVPVGLAGDDPPGHLVADAPHRGQPEPDGRASGVPVVPARSVAPGPAGVHSGPLHDDPVAAGVGHEGLRRPEAHGLASRAARRRRRPGSGASARPRRRPGRRSRPSGSRGSRSWRRRPASSQISSATSPVMPRSGHAGVEAGPQRLHPLGASAWTPWPGGAGRPRPAVKPATSMAICISCSWNSGHPEGLARGWARGAGGGR